MNIDTLEVQNFMQELYTQTQGDTDAQISMHEIGAAIGLEKEAASAMAEDLIIEEWVELKTLSGGIGITEKGLQALGVEGNGGQEAENTLQLCSGRVLNEQGRMSVAAMLDIIKDECSSTQTDYPQIEELVVDIKTIETQLLSTSPKTAILREVFRSLADNLKNMGKEKLANKLG